MAKTLKKVFAIILTLTMLASSVSLALAGDATDAAAERADYTEYNKAYDRLDEIFTEYNSTLNSPAKAYVNDEIKRIADKYSLDHSVISGFTQDEQATLDAVAAEINALCDTLEKGMADGSYINADFTEIEERMAEFEQTYNGEEYNALFAELTAELEAAKAKQPESAAQAADDIAAIESKIVAAESCEHLCHKEGTSGFLWRIINFFFELFGTQSFCECGATHFNHAPENPEFAPSEYIPPNYTTLENPEFVSADNEATNVLVGGD